ncbi:queC [Acrasis kona]|uniref:QueC n=1 Tax=Acrasis kona TaxID=1008807 RepID=A0AAW2ZIT2_9EUKA
MLKVVLCFALLCAALAQAPYFTFTTDVLDFTQKPTFELLINATSGATKKISELPMEKPASIYPGQCVYNRYTNEFVVTTENVDKDYTVDLTTLDAKTGVVKKVTSTHKMTHLEIDDTNHNIYGIGYVEETDTWNFVYYNQTTNEITPQFPIKGLPMLGISTYCQKCRKLFFATIDDEGDFRIIGVDPLEMKVFSDAKPPAYPSALEMDSTKGILYAVLNYNLVSIVVQLDVKSGEVIRQITDLPINYNVFDTLYDPSIKTMYISCKNLQEESKLIAVNMETGKYVFSDELSYTLHCLDK